MREILLGTHNKHKAAEISRLLSGLPVKIRTLDDFPDIKEVEEDGATLTDNAVKKAIEYGRRSGLFTLADDTGLEVKALKGEPGVRSARYAGEKCTYDDNNRKLLEKMAKIKGKKRAARFVCVIACFYPGKDLLRLVNGALEGVILKEFKGENGFGYDPIFYIPECKKTLAELSLDEKNRISHRAKALFKARKIIEEYC